VSALEDLMELHLKVLCQDYNLEMPEKEYRFHKTRRWRFDFAWPKYMVAVECEGGTWSGGRHTRGKGFEGDCEKYNEAALDGWKVFRFTSTMIEGGDALEFLEKAFPPF
jgi:hypothetical protein